MSISIGGSTLTFSDSTTMTTASVAGPPGPAGSPGSAGSTGPAGPTGAAGTNASVVTTYGAIGSYVIAGAPNYNGWTYPGCTASGACLYHTTCCLTTNGGVLNTRINSGGHTAGYVITSQGASLSLSGTWRAMTNSYQPTNSGTRMLNLFVRVS